MSEALLFLPDMMCDARVFGPQIAELSADYAVMVAPLTKGELVSELTQSVLAQAPQRFALAGLGMGEAIALSILRQAPERVTRVALIGGSPLQDLPFDSMEYETFLLKVRSGQFEEAIRTFVDGRVADTAYQPEVIALLADMAQTLGKDVFTRQIRAMQRRSDMQSVLRRYTGPAVVIAGTQDGRIPIKRHQTVADFLPDGTLFQIENAGAFPTIEMPAKVTNALKDWMERPLVLRA